MTKRAWFSTTKKKQSETNFTKKMTSTVTAPGFTTDEIITTRYDHVTSSMESTTVGSDVIAMTTEADEKMDNVFIIAMACFGAGALLVIVAFIFTICWCKKTSDARRKRKQRHRTTVHTRYLKDYSVKTGGAPDEFTPEGSQRSDGLGNSHNNNGVLALGSKNHHRTGGHVNNNGVYQGGQESANGSIKGSDILLVESERKPDGTGLNQESEQKQQEETGLSGDVADVIF